jgi:hypothetical protein
MPGRSEADGAERQLAGLLTRRCDQVGKARDRTVGACRHHERKGADQRNEIEAVDRMEAQLPVKRRGNGVTTRGQDDRVVVGVARDTNSEAILPPAPGLASTITGTPNESGSAAATIRERESALTALLPTSCVTSATPQAR